jgi:hypothetical protein
MKVKKMREGAKMDKISNADISHLRVCEKCSRIPDNIFKVKIFDMDDLAKPEKVRYYCNACATIVYPNYFKEKK